MSQWRVDKNGHWTLYNLNGNPLVIASPFTVNNLNGNILFTINPTGGDNGHGSFTLYEGSNPANAAFVIQYPTDGSIKFCGNGGSDQGIGSFLFDFGFNDNFTLNSSSIASNADADKSSGTNSARWAETYTHGLYVGYKNVIASYSALITDCLIEANTSGVAFTVTLPSANVAGQKIVVVKQDNTINNATITRAGSDTIEGVTSLTLSSQYNKVNLISNGAGVWYDLTHGGV